MWLRSTAIDVITCIDQYIGPLAECLLFKRHALQTLLYILVTFLGSLKAQIGVTEKLCLDLI